MDSDMSTSLHHPSYALQSLFGLLLVTFLTNCRFHLKRVVLFASLTDCVLCKSAVDMYPSIDQ